MRRNRPGKIKYFRAPRQSEAATAWSLFRKFRFSLQQRFHIGQDEAGIKRRRTVGVPYTTFAIDEKDSQNVIERTLRVVGVRTLLDCLAVPAEEILTSER
jgi:hypothetical protein